MMNPHTPRLHMGCGESLHSHWLLSLAQVERKLSAATHKAKAAKRKRGRTRG